jgi:hypothetical protein
MHRSSRIGAEHATRRTPLVARVSAITAFVAAVAVIVAVLLAAHSSDVSTIHSIRPLPRNFFGR